jgi:hypothetical protein
MANVPAPEYQKVWSNQFQCLRREYENATHQYPDAVGVIERVHIEFTDIARLAGTTPTSVGESPPWTKIVLNAAETSRNLYGYLKGKALYSALHGVYAEVLQDLKCVSTGKGQTTQLKEPDNEFREQRRRKRNPSNEGAKKPKTMPIAGIKDPRLRPQQDVPTRNFFAPLRTTDMECEGNKNHDETTEDEVQQGPGSQTGRPPPIVLTSPENLIQLQKKLKGLCKGVFEFRSTRNGTRIISKEMVDYSAIHSYLETHKLPYYTFFPKSLKPIKAVIRHLPLNTPAEDISDGLVNLGFDVISVKKMTTTRRSTTEGPININLPLLPYLGIPSTRKSSNYEASAILLSR